MFDKMKSLMDMQKKMQEVKRQLELAVFEVESSDGLVKITMNGSQEVQGVKFSRSLAQVDSIALEQAVKDAFAKAIKRSQAVAAEKMRDVTGFSLPGA